MNCGGQRLQINSLWPLTYCDLLSQQTVCSQGPKIASLWYFNITKLVTKFCMLGTITDEAGGLSVTGSLWLWKEGWYTAPIHCHINILSSYKLLYQALLLKSKVYWNTFLKLKSILQSTNGIINTDNEYLYKLLWGVQWM